jgi:hypothetical protein
MALWIVQKIRQPAGDDVAEDCIAPGVAVEVTLKDTDSGEFRVFQVCMDPTVDPCAAGGLLYNLNAGGYTPADWDTGCGF